jgi:hypothetical protein
MRELGCLSHPQYKFVCMLDHKVTPAQQQDSSLAASICSSTMPLAHAITSMTSWHAECSVVQNLKLRGACGTRVQCALKRSRAPWHCCLITCVVHAI